MSRESKGQNGRILEAVPTQYWVKALSGYRTRGAAATLLLTFLSGCLAFESKVNFENLPALSIADTPVTEGVAGVQNVRFTLDEPGELDVTIRWQTVDGSAVSDGTQAPITDFTSDSGTIIIPAGDTTFDLGLTILDDALQESVETFTVQVTDVANADLAINEATVTIIDNDSTPDLSISDVAVNENLATVTLTVTLTNPSGTVINFDYATAGVTATAGADFTNSTSTESIPAGNSTYNFTVPIIDDAVFEPNETFTVTLSNPINATIGTAVSTITINEDESPPQISVGDTTVNENAGTVSVTLSTDVPASTDMDVVWTSQNGSGTNPAAAGQDYTTSGGTATITALSTSTTVTIPITDDSGTTLLFEFDETFEVRADSVSGATGATILDNIGVITITDDDTAPDLTIADSSGAENSGTLNFSVTASKVSGRDITYNITYTPNTASLTSDYTTSITTGTILAGSGSATVPVTLVNNSLYETSENFTVSITPTGGSAGLADGTATGTITDDEAAPDITVSDGSANEDTGTITFNVSLSATSDEDVTFNWATSDVSATAGTDYTAESVVGETILAGSTSTVLTVNTSADVIFELDETFDITLSAVSNANPLDPNAIGTIINDEATPQISIDDVPAGESGTPVFTVTINPISDTAVTFDWTTQDPGGATGAVAGTDYVAENAVGATIPALSATTTFDVAHSQDTTDEFDETYNVILSNASGGVTFSDNTGVGTITDDDGIPDISIADAAVTEPAIASLTVSLSQISGKDVAFDFATGPLTALAGADYTSSTSTITIPAGTLTATVNVPTIDDLVNEAIETFQVTLSNAPLANITTATATVTLTDNDPLPALSIDNVAVTESPTATTADFTVTLDAASDQDVTFDWTTVDGTAVSPGDYTSNSATGVTILAGSTTAPISITINNNNAYEIAENFTVAISNPSNATITAGGGIATVSDDDPAPQIAISDVTDVENIAGGQFDFVVTKTGLTEVDCTFNWTTADETAVSPTEYTPDSNSETITSGGTTATISITIIDDLSDENDETFQVNLSGETNCTSSDAQGIGTIQDEDAEPTLIVSNETETEGTDVDFIVTVNPVASGKVIEFDWATADGTAIQPGDYDLTSVFNEQITADTGTWTLTVPTVDDALRESGPAETFTIALSSLSNATIAIPGDETGTGTLNDNELPTVSINSVTVGEGGGTATLNVTLSGPSIDTITVDYETINGVGGFGGAVAGTDFTYITGTTTFTPGDTSEDIVITILDPNTNYEGTETFTVDLTNPTNVAAGTMTGTVTITENDTAPTIDIATTTAAEGSDLVYTVTITGPTEIDAQFDWAAADGTAVGGGTDYTNSSGSSQNIVFATGSTTVSVPTIDDALDENDETVTVDISSPVNAILGTSSAAGTITDGDPLPAITINDRTRTEGQTANLTVTLTPVSGRTVSVNYTTASGTATSGSDFVAASGTVTFPAGSTSQTIPLNTIDDSIPCEWGETYNVNLSGQSNATLGDSSGQITFDDNEPRLSIDSPTVAESVGTLNFTATLDQSCPSLGVSFDWTTSNGTATTAGLDYTANSGTATITAGNTTATLPVTINDDSIGELTETLQVTVSNPTNATILAAGIGTGSITDNDTSPNIGVDDIVISEGDTANVRIFLSASMGSDVTIDYATTPGTATGGGDDYTDTSGTATIPAGSTQVLIAVPSIEDPFEEGNEVLTFGISNANYGTITDSSATVTINNDDTAPNITIAGVTQAEGSTPMNFVVSLSGAVNSPININYSSAAVSATAGTDYTAVSGVLTIPALSLSGTIPVTVIDDPFEEGNETFTVTLDSADYGTITTPTGTGTISNDDTTPNISISGATVTEGSNIVFNVTLDSAVVGSTVTMNYTTTDGSATAGTDYTLTSGVLVIPSASTAETITVPTTDDSADETAAETLTMTISSASYGTITTPAATGTINDNDGLPSLSISDEVVIEGNTATFTVTLSDASEFNVDFNYATVDGTATTAGGDYTANSGTTSITAGSTSTTIDVVVPEDVTWERTEFMDLGINTPVNATIGDSSGQLTINEDDAPPTLSIADITTGEAGTAVYTVTLSEAIPYAVTFDWAASDVNAVAGADYTASSNTGETIPALSTSTTINVPILTDNLDEADETYSVTISNPSSDATLGTAIATGTITDDDSAPVLSIANASAVPEGSNSSFTVSISAISGQDVTFNYASADGTATAGSDYTAVTTSGTITAGSTSTIVIVTSIDDAIFDGVTNENFTVTLSAPSGATLGTSVGTGELIDDEPLRLNQALAAGENITKMEATPDAARMIYIGDQTSVGLNELHATNMAGTTETVISNTLVGGGDVTDFKIASDSSRVIYVADGTTDNSDEIYTVTPAGASWAQLNPSTGNASLDVLDFEISPDDSKVVVFGDLTSDGINELYSVNTISGSWTPLVTGGLSGGEDVTQFAISADSSTVVFVADLLIDDQYDLYSVAITGGAPTKLSNLTASNPDVTDFAISSDSATVVYIADATTGDVFELFSNAIGGGSANQVSPALVGGGDVISLKIAPNSSKVIYLADQSVDGQFELFSADLDGSNPNQVSDTISPSSGDVTAYEISASSGRVVYISDRDVDEDYELFSATLTGGSQQDLNPALPSGGDVIEFSISPDSTKIVAIGDVTTNGTIEIYSVNLSGGSWTTLNSGMTGGVQAGGFKISENSSKVVYVADQTSPGELDIHTVNIGGGSNSVLNAALPAFGAIQLDFDIVSSSSTVIYRTDLVTNSQFDVYLSNL